MLLMCLVLFSFKTNILKCCLFENKNILECRYNFLTAFNPRQTICNKCQALFSLKNYKNNQTVICCSLRNKS